MAQSRYAGPKRYRWRITADTQSGECAEIRVAIGFESTLEIFDTTTPFEHEFEATGHTTLRCVSDSSRCMVAEEWSDISGSFELTGQVSGSATCKFVFDRNYASNCSAGSIL